VIHISKGLIRALGIPSHICLRVNEENTSVAVCPCDASEVLSFKTPEGLFCGKAVKFRISSQEFVRGILQANGLDNEKTYTLRGVYSEQLNAVVCNFDKSNYSV